MNKTKLTTRDIAYIGMFAAIMAACAWISIPAAVPFTLQTQGVFTTLGLLGGKRGTLAVLIYILLGALGLPVFAGFSGGLGVLLGTTGGYILGFLLSALAMWAMERFSQKTAWLALSMVLGQLLCYAAGTAWFMLVYTRTTGPVGLTAVLGWCVIPFILPDLVKIGLSLILTTRLRRFLV